MMVNKACCSLLFMAWRATVLHRLCCRYCLHVPACFAKAGLRPVACVSAVNWCSAQSTSTLTKHVLFMGLSLSSTPHM